MGTFKKYAPTIAIGSMLIAAFAGGAAVAKTATTARRFSINSNSGTASQVDRHALAQAY